MPSTVLLSPDTAPLRTLTLSRVQLDQDEPVCHLTTTGEELCLYSLIGQVQIREVTDGDVWEWGRLGERRKVIDPGVAVLRFPAGCGRTLEVSLEDFSADLLLASCPGLQSPVLPVRHAEDVWPHQVGERTHRREVREVPTPQGYAIACGETINIPGGVSSWPPHATAEDVSKFQAGVTTWQEVFFCICPAPGFAVLDGYYSDGTRADELLRLENGRAYCMPLGSHMCYAAPDGYLYYAWFYCGNALQKQYTKYSDDVGVYRT